MFRQDHHDRWMPARACINNLNMTDGCQPAPFEGGYGTGFQSLMAQGINFPIIEISPLIVY